MNVTSTQTNTEKLNKTLQTRHEKNGGSDGRMSIESRGRCVARRLVTSSRLQHCSTGDRAHPIIIRAGGGGGEPPLNPAAPLVSVRIS